jgi:beta-lactamase regulating signal transducer with metallopeptidase domain
MNLDHLSMALGSLGPAFKNHLWQSTAFSLLAALLALCLRKNYARTRYWIWLAASIKYLIPFSILVSIGSTLASSRQPVAAATTVYNLVYVVSQPFASASTPDPVVVAAKTTSLQGSTWIQMYPILLAAIWVIGFLAVLTAWCVYWRRMSLAIHTAITAGEGPELSALQCLERSGIVNTPIRLLLSDSTLGPGIYGIARPILIWPSRILQRLNEAQIQSILAHEVCHGRSRDNLTATIHMLVEAVFWFHPLVWWLGSRLELERERACDEYVLEFTNAPQIYAESILRV